VSEFETFHKDEMVVYACIRALEIMGEAVKNIPDEIQTAISEDSMEKNSRNP